MKKHDYFDFMESIKNSMADEYERIQKKVLEDPGTAGDQGEENWRSLLTNWLPANYPIVTKGRILNDKGVTSPQVDILVLHPSYPLHLRDKKLYFAGGVVAAFECKLTLKKEHIKKAFENSVIIKKMLPSRIGNPYDELHQLPFFGLLAHSYLWKKNRADSQRKLFDYISEYETMYCGHPRELLDIICIADLGAYSLSKSVCIGPHASEHIKGMFKEYDVEQGVETCYFGHTERPDSDYDSRGDVLGTLVFETTTAMAYEDQSLRHFADYLAGVGVYGGIGRPVFWNSSALSEQVLKRLTTEGYTEPYKHDTWPKWVETF